MKTFGMMLAALAMTALFTGCTTANSHKMLSEDLETLTVHAADIAVLKDTKLPPNSKEKYEAAKRLAEGVDFSLTRSVETLEGFFSPNDAIYSRGVEFGDEIAFYYHYQDHYVRFRFWHTKHAVTDSEVRVK